MSLDTKLCSQTHNRFYLFYLFNCTEPNRWDNADWSHRKIINWIQNTSASVCIFRNYLCILIEQSKVSFFLSFSIDFLLRFYSRCMCICARPDKSLELICIYSIVTAAIHFEKLKLAFAFVLFSFFSFNYYIFCMGYSYIACLATDQ